MFHSLLIITNHTWGIIERNATSHRSYEVEWYFQDHEIDAIMLIVGFLPGLKLTIIPLLKQIPEPEALMIDEFVTDIREFSTSVSGCNSPAAIIVFGDHYYSCMSDVIEKLDYAMSPETVIVGDALSKFRCTSDAQFGTSAAVALVFAVDRNKPPGNIKIHTGGYIVLCFYHILIVFFPYFSFSVDLIPSIFLCCFFNFPH
ncbi:hypothetical protein HanPI659440_Chr02g0036921 [Helianthus annuus]|nr:hypothetical protein HanPI659440_Chr02g0036921 [Helianthus annuus]